MRTAIAKSWTFDAAHQLPNHDGKCAQPHGHTYTLTVALVGEPAPCDGRADEGMVADFGALDAVWRRLRDQVDHRDLTKTVPVTRTTSELLAAWFYKEFADALPARTVAYVRVSETASTYAEVRG